MSAPTPLEPVEPVRPICPPPDPDKPYLYDWEEGRWLLVLTDKADEHL